MTVVFWDFSSFLLTMVTTCQQQLQNALGQAESSVLHPTLNTGSSGCPS